MPYANGYLLQDVFSSEKSKQSPPKIEGRGQNRKIWPQCTLKHTPRLLVHFHW